MLYVRARLLRLKSGGVEHFMCNRAGKNDNHIRRAYLIFEIRRALRKHLAFTAEAFADFLITAVHPVVTADNYNTHFSLRINRRAPPAKGGADRNVLFIFSCGTRFSSRSLHSRSRRRIFPPVCPLPA